MKKTFAIALFLLWCSCAFAVQKSPTVVYIGGSKYYIHTVQPGETLYSLSREYAVGDAVIRESNPAIATDGLKAGSNLKIPFLAQEVDKPSAKQIRKNFDTHIVTKGETLYGLSRKYEIPVQSIVDDNPNIDPIHLRLGDKLLIRKQERGSVDEATSKAGWEQYRDKLNSVAQDGTSYHLVHPGETFYSLARRFGATEEALSNLNSGMKPADLRAGAIIRVPGTPDQSAAATAIAVISEPENLLPVIEQPQRVELRTLNQGEAIDVAILLPISVEGEANSNYLEFYQGFLLGLDSVRRSQSISVNLGLHNTGRNADKIAEIAQSSELINADLIVGPVYEEVMSPILKLAEQSGAAVVSPLAHLTNTSSNLLFQLAPAPIYKYDKVASLLDGSRHVTLIYSSSTDKEFEQEILTALGTTPFNKHTYHYAHPSAGGQAGSASDLSSLLDNGQENLFVVMADNEIDVDRILAAIASADTNITARGRSNPRFMVLGNTRWNRYNNIDRAMFFKDRVVFVSTYHAKRDSEVVADFDKNYIRAFGTLPTLYSYRGYDAAVIFLPAMHSKITSGLEDQTITPLQTTYRFGSDGQNPSHVNRNWMRINYNPDFTITIE